ncbi:unnamed protein product [Leptosia nina]|uniref:3-hydroxyisobutyryl-CoA hydrolase, mitochondrial n=1 Tax=Leptosia nina TaxID=320188 RepID=A0AAV1J8K4_9NEOP
MQHNIIFNTVNNVGFIILNRPESKNALNQEMYIELKQYLREWEKNKKLIIIKSAVENVFSAGGDLKAVKSKTANRAYFSIVYNTIYLIANYKIPYVAFMSGITLGGGLGVSIHGQYRVATDRTVVAMPEARLGYFPDVGASYFLPRLPDYVGTYMGLTGEKIKGNDVVTIGLGTHFVSSTRLEELEDALVRTLNKMEVGVILNKFNEPAENSTLAPHFNDIKLCFSASTVEGIMERLKSVNNDWSIKTIHTLQSMCPASLKITLRALQRGAQMELLPCLKMEYRMISRVFDNHDFREGVRAYITQKHQKPKWHHKSIGDVDEDHVESYFRNLPVNEEFVLTASKI